MTTVGLMEDCPVGPASPCSDWVYKYFGDCVCSKRDWVSFGLGMTSIFCWGVAEVPQIVTNWKTGRSEGISLAFILTWTVGDIFNLVGCLLSTVTLPTQIYTALLYTVTTLFLLGQHLWYSSHAKKMPEYSDVNWEQGASKYLSLEGQKQVRMPLLTADLQADENTTETRDGKHVPKSGRPPLTSPSIQIQKTERDSATYGSRQSRAVRNPRSGTRVERAQGIHVGYARHSWPDDGGRGEHLRQGLEDGQICIEPMDDSEGRPDEVSHSGGALSESCVEERYNAMSRREERRGIAITTARHTEQGSYEMSWSPGVYTGSWRKMTFSPSFGHGSGSRLRAVMFGMLITTGIRLGSISVFGSLPATRVKRPFVLIQRRRSLLQEKSDMSAAAAQGMHFHRAVANKIEGWEMLDSEVISCALGWVMTAIYLGGRLPQIIMNISRGTVEGLSLAMFAFAIGGNATYLGSILVRSLKWERIMPNLPWLVDSACCLVMDFFILGQFLYYRKRRADDYMPLK